VDLATPANLAPSAPQPVYEQSEFLMNVLVIQKG